MVKGNAYEVSELCGSSEVGKRYNGGELNGGVEGPNRPRWGIDVRDAS